MYFLNKKNAPRVSRKSRIFNVFAAFTVAASALVPVLVAQPVAAAQLTARSLTLSSSSPAAATATTTYTLAFTTGTTATFQSFQAQMCTTASGACTSATTVGFSASASTFTSSTIAGTWAVNTGTAGALKATVSSGSASTTSGTAKNIIFGGVQNPTTANQTIYARVTLYSDTAYTTAVDTGVVAASTGTNVDLTASVDETLSFSVASATVALGTLSTGSTNSGTSTMTASTNATSGYAITINGATLTSGANTITALASQTASSIGSSQFGVNLKANTTPSVGANVSGSGTATATANYATADQFRFVTGDTVASVAVPTAANTFTVSYIANISGTTKPGSYTATMTYICTPTF